MSGGLNGAALPAYTNFLFVFSVYQHIGKENKKVDWAQHRATSRVVHNTVSHTFITTGSTLSAENNFRFVYTVWLAKMWKMWKMWKT